MTIHEALRTLAFDAIRATVYGVVIIMLLIGATILYGNREADTLEDINNGTKATVCVLALPVDPVSGRNQADVRNCLIESGLRP